MAHGLLKGGNTTLVLFPTLIQISHEHACLDGGKSDLEDSPFVKGAFRVNKGTGQRQPCESHGHLTPSRTAQASAYLWFYRSTGM